MTDYTYKATNAIEESLLLSTAPPTNEEIADLQIKDWADSLTQITAAVRTLEHALPLASSQGIEQSFKRLSSNMHSLRLFLLVRGFNV
jgi:valyl-tRNA synthetase